MKFLSFLLLVTVLTTTNCSGSTKKGNDKADEHGKTIKEHQTSFHKTLSMGEYSFDISSDGNQLTVKPSGQEIVNDLLTTTINGKVVDAEIGDLNNDGFPEVLIYVASGGDDSHQTAYGYSSNNGKSMSEFYIPPVSDNNEINQGFQGHNEFALVEGNLSERFPILGISGKEGKTRQIQYKLIDGESSRILKVDSVAEF